MEKELHVQDRSSEDGWDPVHYGHPRMPLEERAKIFSPFDPLRGFREELRRRERLVLERQHHEPKSPEDDIA